MHHLCNWKVEEGIKSSDDDIDDDDVVHADGDDVVDVHDDGDDVVDIYIMMKCLSVCVSRKMITFSWESPVTT